MSITTKTRREYYLRRRARIAGCRTVGQRKKKTVHIPFTLAEAGEKYSHLLASEYGYSLQLTIE